MDKFSSYCQCDLVCPDVRGGASSQVCLVFLGRASSFPVSLLPRKPLFQAEPEYIAFLIGDLDYLHLLPLPLEQLCIRCSVVLRENFFLKRKLFLVLEVHKDLDLISTAKENSLCHESKFIMSEVRTLEVLDSLSFSM